MTAYRFRVKLECRDSVVVALPVEDHSCELVEHVPAREIGPYSPVRIASNTAEAQAIVLSTTGSV